MPRRRVARRTTAALGVSAAAVFAALSEHLPDDAVVAVDVGNHAYSLGRYLESKGQPVLMSGYLGSIGFGYPAAIGAWAADPDRPVVAVTGDGGFGQYAMELNTAVKYGIPIKHVLLNNNALGKISKEQLAADYPVWHTSLQQPGLGRLRRALRRDRHQGHQPRPAGRRHDHPVRHTRPGPALHRAGRRAALSCTDTRTHPKESPVTETAQPPADYADLKALFINCTLKRSPEPSNTQGLVDISRHIMEAHGVQVDVVRAIDHDIATGVWPDMTEHGWETDDWPAIFEKVKAADILVLAGPIWLGDNSSIMKQVHERLYGGSHLLNEQGQYLYYGRVGGCLITGNEDGIKHCAHNVLYTLQHIGYTIPPQADAGWIGEAGPGPSYLDPGSGGPENDFTNRNTTFMTWNLMHLARLLKDAGGVPAYGNQRSEWDAGCRFDFENPEYR